MASDNRNRQPANAISFSGLLTIICGTGLLLAVRKYRSYSDDWSQLVTIVLSTIAGILILYGLWQSFATVRPSATRQGLGQINRHRFKPPREGLMYLAIMSALFIGSLLGRSNTLMLVFATMAGPFILNGWITFSLLKRTTLRRVVPARAMAGELVSVEIVLENKKRWISAWLMAVRDRIAGGGEILDAAILFARVPPQEKRTGYYQMRLGRRGEYHFGPMELSTRFPLGLVERGLIFDNANSIIVHPRIGRLTSHWKRDIQMPSEYVQRSTTRPGAFDDDFHRIREHRWGDNPRAIHWRTSARRNELMVKEFHQSRDLALAVALDLWIPKHPTERDWNRVELAVSFVATICLEQVRQSRDSELTIECTGRDRASWSSAASGAAIVDILDMLAVLQAGSAKELEPMMESLLAAQTAHRRVIVVTTRKISDEETPMLVQFQNHMHPADPAHAVQVVEADEQILQSFFAID